MQEQQFSIDRVITYLKNAKTLKALSVSSLGLGTIAGYLILTTVGQTLQSITGIFFGINNVIFILGLIQLLEMVKTKQYPEMVTDLYKLYQSVFTSTEVEIKNIESENV
jgi:hypothetical protein